MSLVALVGRLKPSSLVAIISVSVVVIGAAAAAGFWVASFEARAEKRESTAAYKQELEKANRESLQMAATFEKRLRGKDEEIGGLFHKLSEQSVSSEMQQTLGRFLHHHATYWQLRYISTCESEEMAKLCRERNESPAFKQARIQYADYVKQLMDGGVIGPKEYETERRSVTIERPVVQRPSVQPPFLQRPSQPPEPSLVETLAPARIRFPPSGQEYVVPGDVKLIVHCREGVRRLSPGSRLLIDGVSVNCS